MFNISSIVSTYLKGLLRFSECIFSSLQPNCNAALKFIIIAHTGEWMDYHCPLDVFDDFFYYLNPLFRLKGFCITVLLGSIIGTIFMKFQYAKKKRNQKNQVGNQRSPSSSLALVEPPIIHLNVISANDSMISFKTLITISFFSLLCFMIWSLYSSFTAGFIYFNMLIGFFLIFTVTPPLYFFTRFDKFKFAVTLVFEMFI